MDSNTSELMEIWKKSIPQDHWASIQRISQLIDGESLDYCINRWMDDANILYNTISNQGTPTTSTPEDNLLDNLVNQNLLDNLIGPYRKCELMLALLCIKKRNLIEFREKIEKILQLARQDAENDKLNKNFIGSVASAIKNYVTTPGGQYNCEIEKDDKCYERGIKNVISSLSEYPKCHPPTLMYVRHRPEEEFLNKSELHWKADCAIPDEKKRIEILEKKIPGITAISPTSTKPPMKKDEKPSFLRRKPSYSFLRNSSNRPTMRQNNINISSGGVSLLAKKNNAPRRNMLLDLEEVNRLNQKQEEERRLAQKREEEEKAAAEREKERKKKEELARKQKEKEERERERAEKRKKKQREAEEEKKRKEALKEAKEKEAREKEKKKQEALAAAREAKEKEAREKELRKLKEKEAKEKQKQERILQRENSVTSPVKRRTRKKRRVGNESVDSSVNNSEANTPVLPQNKALNDVSEMNPDQNNMYNNGNGMNPYDNNNNNYYNGQEPSRQNSAHSNDPDEPYFGQQQHQQQQHHHHHPQDMEPNHNYYNQQPPNGMNNNGYDPNGPPPPNHDNGYPSYPNMNEYAEILGNTNQLTMDQRQFIVDFLNGKKVSDPNETSRIIPLNVETYEDPQANLSIREIIEFEMNFQNGTWRKLKKIKKSIINAKE